MATRYAKVEFDDLVRFFDVIEEIRSGNFLIPRAALDDEPAPDLRVDLTAPLIGRVGPIEGQVVFRGDEAVGLRVLEFPSAVQKDLDAFDGVMDQVQTILVRRGQLIPKTALDEAQAELVRVRAEADEAVKQAARAARAAAAAGASAGGGGVPVVQEERGQGLLLPDLADRDPDAEGELSDRSLRDALVDIAVKRYTGLLTIVQSDGTHRFGFIYQGGPVGWRSEPLEKESVLGVLLYRAGQITEEQLKQSLQIMEERGCRQGEAFIEMGVMTFAQLVMVLQKQCEFVLQQVMRLRDGAWAFHQLDALPENFVNPPLRVPSLLFRALKDYARELPTEQLSARLKPLLDQYVTFKEDVIQVMSEIRFSKEEKKFIEIVSSRSWRMREIFSVSNLSRVGTAGTVWAFLELEFLAIKESEDLERYLNRISGRIITKRDRLASNHAFDVLEMHWICLDHEVEAAHRKLLDEFDPKKFHDLTPELADAIKRIRTAADEAYEKVKDRKLRGVYREEIVEDALIRNSAELLAKKGEMAIMRGDGREALNCYQKAHELVPQHPEYRDGLNRARGLR